MEKSSCQCCQDGYAGATIIAERIRASLQAVPTNEGSGSHVRVIVSAGGAEWHGGDTIIGKADDALHRAKEAGRNHVEISTPPGLLSATQRVAVNPLRP